MSFELKLNIIFLMTLFIFFHPIKVIGVGEGDEKRLVFDIRALEQRSSSRQSRYSRDSQRSALLTYADLSLEQQEVPVLMRSSLVDVEPCPQSMLFCEGQVNFEQQQRLHDELYKLDGMLFPYIISLLKRLRALSLSCSPSCFICYAWPSDAAEQRQRQHTIRIIRQILRAANIKATMDIEDNEHGTLDEYRDTLLTQNYVLLLGSREMQLKLQPQQMNPDADLPMNNITKEVDILRHRMRREGLSFVIPVSLDDRGHAAVQAALQTDAVYADWSTSRGLMEGVLMVVEEIYKRFTPTIDAVEKRDLLHEALHSYQLERRVLQSLLQSDNLSASHFFGDYRRVYDTLQYCQGLYQVYQQFTLMGEIYQRNTLPFVIGIVDEQEDLSRIVWAIDAEKDVGKLAQLHEWIGKKLCLKLQEEERAPVRDERLKKLRAEFADTAYFHAHKLYCKIRRHVDERQMGLIIEKCTGCLMQRGKLRRNGLLQDCEGITEVGFYNQVLEMQPHHCKARFYLLKASGGGSHDLIESYMMLIRDVFRERRRTRDARLYEKIYRESLSQVQRVLPRCAVEEVGDEVKITFRINPDSRFDGDRD